jgi:hypothetical protein
MRMRRRWAWLLTAGSLGAAVLAALLEPTGTVRAFLAGEHFYRDRPTRYWREVLRGHGRSGRTPAAAVMRAVVKRKPARRRQREMGSRQPPRCCSGMAASAAS